MLIENCPNSPEIGIIPEISENTLQYLTKELTRGEYDVIVEYGSGFSTQYFLRQLKNIECKTQFVSVDRDSHYFNLTLNDIRTHFGSSEYFSEAHASVPWSDEKIKQYIAHKGPQGKDWEYPVSVRRFQKSQKDFITHFGCDSNIEGVPSYIFNNHRLVDCSYFARLTR
ncbi:MAG: hypothetical protein KDD60_06895, partial [Bdellovibrionales bacterium]|nr:hypothetical protein [Bdellovibrionales bacterium]